MPSLNFKWEHPTLENQTFSLYENDKKVVGDIAALNFSLDMTGKSNGVYSYTMTTYDTKTRLESIHSQPLKVNFVVPAAPTGFSVSWG